VLVHTPPNAVVVRISHRMGRINNGVSGGQIFLSVPKRPGRMGQTGMSVILW
jgi:hypothetical protein